MDATTCNETSPGGAIRNRSRETGWRSKLDSAAYCDLSPLYLRYVDDFALFHDDPERLEGWRLRIARFLEGRRLRLHPRKTVIVETKESAEFLGFVLLPGGLRRLPDANVRRFRNRLRSLRDRWRQGTVTREEVERRVGAWVAHAEHANTRHLRRAIFRDGWFDPSRGPDRPPVSAWCAAARGTTNPRNLRSANRNRNTTANRNDNNGFRVARTLDSPSRRPHGATGCATERPGTVMTSEGPAPLLPRSGGGEALAFVFAQDHRRQRDWRPRRQSPVRVAGPHCVANR